MTTPMARRQLYRLRTASNGDGAPEWLRPDGVYEGDLGPASQGDPGGTVRLQCPDDPAACYMVDGTAVEEVES